MNEPMTDERLRDIKERAGQVGCLDCGGHCVTDDEVRSLLAEVERLRSCEPKADADPLQEIADLIEEADRIHRSTADWETKFHLIFAIDIRSKIKAAGLEFDYYDPDTTYEADVTAYVEALKGFRGRWGNLIPEAS